MRQRLAAAFLLGMVMGSALATGLVAGRVEHLWRQRQELMFLVADQEGRIRILTDSLAEERDSLVERFVVVLEGVDALDELQLSQGLRELMAPLVGKPVSAVDGSLLLNLLDGRLLEVNRKWYRVHPQVIVLAPTVEILVQARQIPHT